MIAALLCAWPVPSGRVGSSLRPSGIGRRASQPEECSRPSSSRQGSTARGDQHQRLAVAGASNSISVDSGSAAQCLLQLSQQHDTRAADDRHFYKQLTAEERLTRIQMLLQQGVTEETVECMIKSTKGGPYMQSVSEGAAALAVLRERGCSDADMNCLLRWQPNIVGRPASRITDVFAALDDMLQLSRPNILRALQQLYGCSLQQAQRVLMRTSQLAHYKLEAPKFQCRVVAVTEWYGHTSPAAMLLAPSRGSLLQSSLWKLGARMAFIRRLRLEQAEPCLSTCKLAETTERFCRAVGVSEAEYAAFEQCWLASPEAAELCRHEAPPHVKVTGAAGTQPEP